MCRRPCCSGGRASTTWTRTDTETTDNKQKHPVHFPFPSVEKARRGHHVGAVALRRADDAVPVPGHEGVQSVSPYAWYDTPQGERPPRTADVLGQTERRVGTGERAFAGRAEVVDPDHRVETSQRRMAFDHSVCGAAAERGEAERVRPFVAEDKQDRAVAQRAAPVVQEHRAAVHARSDASRATKSGL